LPRTTDSFRSISLAILSLILVPLFVFSPSVLRDHFVNWDDEGQLYQNPDFNPPTFHSVVKYWRTPHMNLYMPITYSLWGSVAAVAKTPPDRDGIALNPVWFHALNLMLHIAATLAAWMILRNLNFKIFPAWAGAMLLAIHPIQTEAVCWASGMYTVLSGLLIFLTLDQYIRFANSPSHGRAHYLLATLFFAAAMLSKPSAMVALPMAAVIDLLLIRRRFRPVILSLTPWLILTLPIILILQHSQPAAIVPDQPLFWRIAVAFHAIGFYSLKLLIPLNSAVDYGLSPTWLRDHPQALWIATIPLLALAAGWKLRQRFPWLLAGFGLLIAGTLPFLGLVKFDFQHFSTVADRYAYPGVLGFSLIAAGLLESLRKSTVKIFAAVILSLLAARTYFQTLVWSDTDALFTHNLEINPTSLQANSNLGFLDMSRGQTNLAIDHYRRALAADPTDADANVDLANALSSQGDFTAAIGHFQTALEVTPDDPRIHNNLGIALARAHRYPEAAAQFQTALDENGSNPDPGQDVRAAAHTNLGLILEVFGQTAQADSQYRAALAINPNFQLAREALSRLQQRVPTR
jgi:Tfp pilus assembly protein PilF